MATEFYTLSELTDFGSLNIANQLKFNLVQPRLLPSESYPIQLDPAIVQRVSTLWSRQEDMLLLVEVVEGSHILLSISGKKLAKGVEIDLKEEWCQIISTKVLADLSVLVFLTNKILHFSADLSLNSSVDTDEPLFSVLSIQNTTCLLFADSVSVLGHSPVSIKAPSNQVSALCLEALQSSRLNRAAGDLLVTTDYAHPNRLCITSAFKHLYVELSHPVFDLQTVVLESHLLEVLAVGGNDVSLVTFSIDSGAFAVCHQKLNYSIDVIEEYKRIEGTGGKDRLLKYGDFFGDRFMLTFSMQTEKLSLPSSYGLKLGRHSFLIEHSGRQRALTVSNSSSLIVSEIGDQSAVETEALSVSERKFSHKEVGKSSIEEICIIKDPKLNCYELYLQHSKATMTSIWRGHGNRVEFLMAIDEIEHSVKGGNGLDEMENELQLFWKCKVSGCYSDSKL